MTGTSAKVAVGAAVKGFVDEDVPLALAAATQQPLVVGASAAPMTVTPVSTSTVVAPANPSRR